MLKQILAVVVFLALSAQAPAPVPSGDIEAHLRFLADDELEGREAGTRGYDLAADYVTETFEALGLIPGAPRFRQPVTLQRRVLAPNGVTASLTLPEGDVALINGLDFAIDAGHVPYERIEAPLVFVGWGIHAPQLGHDDYAGLNVAGKIVVLLERAPPSFPPALRAHFSWIDQKDEMAAVAGAVGLLTVKSPAREAVSPWERARLNRPLPALSWLGAGGQSDKRRTGITGTLSPEMARRLLSADGRDADALIAEIEAGRQDQFDLDAVFRMTRRSEFSQVVSDNVIGVIPGADPALADEFVVVTAHLDHVGIGRPVNGDKIYNGAADNAVGVAVMLDVARRLRASTPARSVLFLATTAEEKGLLGAEYFVRHPTIPLDQIVSVINIDGMPAFYDFVDIVALGAEHSDLGAISEAAAARVGAVHGPDPTPERGNLALSDQYPFLKEGIPVLFPLPGRAVGRDGENAEAIWSDFMGTRYHQPSDDLNQPWRWDVLERWSTYITGVVHGAANAESRPSWRKGDPLGRLSAPNR